MSTAPTHEQIWNAIDLLAFKHGLTPSGLARRAGLDATLFNKSKRISADGHKRWPSTQTLSRILDVTGSSLADFVGLIEKASEIERIRRAA